MNSILGAVVAGYGLYLGFYGLNTTDDVSLMLWVKSAAAVLVGLGIVGYNSYSSIKEWVKNWKEGKTVSVNVNKVDEAPIAGIAMRVEQEKDNDVLFYLTERLKNSPEGLEYCRKINDLLFSIHHTKEESK